MANINIPINQYVDGDGPLIGAKAFFYAGGSTVPKRIYNDYTLSSVATQPLVSDALGVFPQVYSQAGSYRIQVYDRNNNLIATRDWVDFGGGSDSYPAPLNSGYLHYDLATDTYTWQEVNADTYKVKVNSADATPDYLDAKLADATDIQFTPVDGKMDSIVYQLTGIGARLVDVDTGDFDWSGFNYGSTRGGRGICAGRAFISGIDTVVWGSNDGVGYIYKSTDNWKTNVFDDSFVQHVESIDYQPPCLKFVYMEVFSSYAWVISAWPIEPNNYYYALHNAGNYNTDGTIKVEAWTQGTVAHTIADIGIGPDNVACAVGNHRYVMRTTDWDTWVDTEVFTTGLAIGGIDTDGYEKWLVVHRDSGVVKISTDNAITWTAPQIYSRNTEEGSYVAVAQLHSCGSVVCGNGVWLVTGATKYSYSTDGIYWTTYDSTLGGQFYGCGFDGVRFFATNPNETPSTKIYQLLVSEIPAHKHLVAEEGITIDKNTYLPYLPNAGSLATDAMGKVIAGSGGVNRNYSTTIDIAVGVDQYFVITHNLGYLRPYFSITYADQQIITNPVYLTTNSLAFYINSAVVMTGANVEVSF